MNFEGGNPFTFRDTQGKERPSTSKIFFYAFVGKWILCV